MTTIQGNVTGRKPTVAHSVPTSVDPDELVDAAEAAKLLRQKLQTLAGWRCDDRGPPYLKVGRSVIYRRSDLSAWLASQIIQPGNAA